MPIYEYVCSDCDEHFEVEQRMTDDPLTTHDACGGPVKKVFSSAGVVLKGSGFYKTDTRSSTKSSGSSQSSSSDSTSSSSTSTTSSDSKPSSSPGGSSSSGGSPKTDKSS